MDSSDVVRISADVILETVDESVSSMLECNDVVLSSNSRLRRAAAGQALFQYPGCHNYRDIHSTVEDKECCQCFALPFPAKEKHRVWYAETVKK